MMRHLSFKITSSHMRICVFLILLWAVTDSSTMSTASTGVLTTTSKSSTEADRRLVTTPLTTISPTKPTPENVKTVTVLTQNETSITLMWDKVNNISTYLLQYKSNGSMKVDNINSSNEGTSVTHVVSQLTAGTKYNLTLITVFEEVNSTGYTFEAITVPPEVTSVSVTERSVTSITLTWAVDEKEWSYFLDINGQSFHLSPNESSNQLSHSVSSLKPGTKYPFSVITTFSGLNSTAYENSTVTVPPEVTSVSVTERSVTSITLTWAVDEKEWSYFLDINGQSFHLSPNESSNQLSHSVSSLKPGTKYPFSVITTFSGLNSTAYENSTVTVPPEVTSVSVTERSVTSITLTWAVDEKEWSYFLDINGQSFHLSPNESSNQLSHSVSSLKPGTKYPFSVITTFSGLNSTAYENSTVTVPSEVTSVSVTERSVTSITLTWLVDKKDWSYFLDINGQSFHLFPNESSNQLSHSVPSLEPGTEYPFSVITMFSGFNSTVYNDSTVTVPSEVTIVSVTERSVTSITLTWPVDKKDWSYFLDINGQSFHLFPNESSNQLSHLVPSLEPGTEYPFSVITMFSGFNSTVYNDSTVTVPSEVTIVSVTERSVTSITLTWPVDKKDWSYFLDINGQSFHLFPNESSNQLSRLVPSLEPGTEYQFNVTTMFSGFNSTVYNDSTVTVPSEVTIVNVTERSVTSITLTWPVDKKDWSYFLDINGQSFPLCPNESSNQLSHLVPSLEPGTEYQFNVTTMFSGFNSTAYVNSTVTAIDCTSVPWHVTNSSIQGVVEGLFSYATATNTSKPHFKNESNNVLFTDLYPGATYEVSLVYEKDSLHFQQCRHSLTINPPDLHAHCKYWAGGYSVFIVWDKPDGLWTEVEVNVKGQTHKVNESKERQIKIPGFQPAKTYEVSLTSVVTSETERRSNTFVFPCQTDPRGVIAGSVCAVLLFVLLVLLVVFILRRRPGMIGSKKPLINGSRKSHKKSKTISMAEFPDHFHWLSMDDNRGFSLEYESLMPVGTEQTRKEALLPENKARNRFTNVLPYDWCRVKLTTSNLSDYINASYMPGYNSNREYIATQGPLPSTVNDFWRMIWEQRVKGIVMVTNCTEGGRTKCEQYWPADSVPRLYGDLLVTMRSEQRDANWTLREFRVTNKNTSEERTVKHFHFTAWPDHGVPQGTEVLIRFRRLLRQHIERDGTGTPTVVHCSAGVGRTGTIIALDVLLQQLEEERSVGINDFVHKMRLSRPHMVQTESQYVFLHQCIMDSLQPKIITEENIYENDDMIYVNATALREFHSKA